MSSMANGHRHPHRQLAVPRPAPPKKITPASAAVSSGELSPARALRRAGEPPAVKVIGYLGSEKGVGEGARATIRALRAGGVPFLLETLHDPTSEEDAPALRESHDRAAQINIFHVNPKELIHLRDRLIAERTAGRVTIGYWAWELPDVPAPWAECLGYVDEVWTPSSFVSEAVARSAFVPVLTVPHCLDLDALDSGGTPPPSGRFTFLFAFDYRSDLGRKNPVGVIEAFRRAFTPKDSVELIVKSMHSSFDPEGAAAVRAAAGTRVRIVDGLLPRAEFLRVLKGCDCYVSLHRAEGFGLSLAEAMALGKPVIATGYSGNLDFMTAGNSLLVSHSMVEVGAGHGDYEAHQRWAEPDLDHAASLMRAVAEDRAMAARVGAQARRDVVRVLDPAAVGPMIRHRLLDMAHLDRPDPMRPGARCSIVIPVYGQASMTRNCLNSLLSGRRDPRIAEIIVVDDASPDETPSMLREFGDSIRIVTHPQNMGFGRSCNDGAAAARSDMLVLLNNDTVPHRGWLEALMTYALAHPEAGIIGSKLLYPSGRLQHAGVVICEDRRPRHLYRGFPGTHPAVSVSRRLQVVTGACMLVHRPLFAKLGGFDIAFRNGFEDVDLCLRAGEIGSQVHYCADSVLEHYESATRHGRPEEELRNFQLYWDRWAHRVIPDEFAFYSADGLLRIKQIDRYPLEFDISPELGVVPGPTSTTATPTGRPAPAMRTRTGSAVRPRMPPPLAPGW
jgi:GT2 family glycosyltransferase/glycosyltransferase involved in cell wall biosynthesis